MGSVRAVLQGLAVSVEQLPTGRRHSQPLWVGGLAVLWLMQSLVWLALGFFCAPTTVVFVLAAATGQFILAGAVLKASHSESLCDNLNPIWPALTLALLLLGGGGFVLAGLQSSVVLALGELVLQGFGFAYWCHFRESRPASATWR